MRNRTRGLLRSTGAGSDGLDCEPALICRREQLQGPSPAWCRPEPDQRETSYFEDESLSARAFYLFAGWLALLLVTAVSVGLVVIRRNVADILSVLQLR